ncbi:MAG: hypothetical protein KY434_06405 [Actinobacteria bacterium]|nr:hypothetical protein [Actinomycetota bacterium]
MTRPWPCLAELASRQHGAVHRRQAEVLGVPGRTLSAWVAGGGWRRLQRAVYTPPGSPDTFERRVGAALLAAGPRVLAARSTAARLWRLTDSCPVTLDLVVPVGRGVPRLTGVMVTRSRTLLRADAAWVDGLAVTSVDRTICDLAATLGEAELRELVAVAVQRRATTLDAIGVRLRRLSSPRGGGRLRAVLLQLQGDQTDSTLERRVRRLLCEGGLPPHPGIFSVEHRGRVIARVDIAYPAHRVGIEVDGYAFHATPQQLRADHARANRLAAAGWVLLRVGHEQLNRDPLTFVDHVRALVRNPG